MIFLTRVIQPESGALVAVYCKYCRRTEIAVSPYALRPKDGDMWLVSLPCLKHCFYRDLFELPTIKAVL